MLLVDAVEYLCVSKRNILDPFILLLLHRNICYLYGILSVGRLSEMEWLHFPKIDAFLLFKMDSPNLLVAQVHGNTILFEWEDLIFPLACNACMVLIRIMLDPLALDREVILSQWS